MPPETGQGKNREICLETDRLQGNVTRLGEVLGNAFEALNNVLAPDLPSPKQPETAVDQRAASPLAEILRSANNALEGDIKRLAELVDRVEA